MLGRKSFARAKTPWIFAAYFCLGVTAGCSLYVAAIISIIDEQAFLRDTYVVLNAKLRRLETAGRPPHLIVISGSNALFSVNSAALSDVTGMTMTNAAMQWSYTPFVMERVIERIIPGDIVLLPLEYEYYDSINERPMLEACFLLSQARQYITGVADWVSVLTECSPKLVLQGMRTKFLMALGASFPTPGENIDTLITAEGDYRANLLSQAIPVVPLTGPLMPAVSPDWVGPPRIGRAIEKMGAEGAIVYLSFPVKPVISGDFVVAAPEWLAAYDAWARSLGAETISSPDAHLFPVDCFFDSAYHLHQGCTGENSMTYGRAIVERLSQEANQPARPPKK